VTLSPAAGVQTALAGAIDTMISAKTLAKMAYR